MADTRLVQTSEYCGVGHPDRTCDAVASLLLENYLAADPFARVALEVQLKDEHMTVSGEVTTHTPMSFDEMDSICREALERIGYTDEYRDSWGDDNCVCGSDLDIVAHISQQSPDIARGVDADGWGDQGIFWGLAVDCEETCNMPLDHFLARGIAQELHISGLGGLDIKTQVTTVGGEPTECVVAIPLMDNGRMDEVEERVRRFVLGDCHVIVNGTGSYVRHGSVGDCGTTGRKLVADFYGGASRIGGGSPWGKDPTKADVALNVYARIRALQFMKEHGVPVVQCGISCCIGRRRIRLQFLDGHNRLLELGSEELPARDIIDYLGLRKARWFDLCAGGLFGHGEW